MEAVTQMIKGGVEVESLSTVMEYIFSLQELVGKGVVSGSEDVSEEDVVANIQEVARFCNQHSFSGPISNVDHFYKS